MNIRELDGTLKVKREYTAKCMLPDCTWLNTMALANMLHDTGILKYRKEMLLAISFRRNGNIVHIQKARNLQQLEIILDKAERLGDDTLYLFHVISGSPQPVMQDSVSVRNLVEASKRHPVKVMDFLTIPCNEYGYESGTMYSFEMGTWCHFKPLKRKSCCHN